MGTEGTATVVFKGLLWCRDRRSANAPPRVETSAAWRRGVAVITSTVIFAALVRLPRAWTPLGDNALMRMWTDAVGTGSTPLVGSDARFGWNHLGPWVFYLMAFPYRLLGSSSVGLLVGAGAINVISLVAIMRCVREVAGERAAALVSAGAMLFLVTATGDRLIDPWNPYVVQLPFLLTITACWAVLNQRWRWLPWLVGAGSLCVQAHIAFLVPVAVLMALAVSAVVRSTTSISKRTVRQMVVVAVVAWLPPVIDLFLPRGHNVYRIARFFVGASATPANGLHAGIAVVLHETGLGASWLSGHIGLRVLSDDFDGRLGLLPGIGILMLVAATLVARRRHDAVLGSLVVLLAALVPAAAVEISLGQGALYPYLFGWVTIVGMLCWVAGILAVLTLVGARSARTVNFVSGAAGVGMAVWLLVVGVDAQLPRSPLERPSDAAIVRQLVASSEQRLSRDTNYRLDHGSDSFNSIYELGVVDELRVDGYRITVEPNNVVLFGRHMIDDHAASYPALKVVAPYESTVADCTVADCTVADCTVADCTVIALSNPPPMAEPGRSIAVILEPPLPRRSSRR